MQLPISIWAEFASLEGGMHAYLNTAHLGQWHSTHSCSPMGWRPPVMAVIGAFIIYNG